MKTLRVRWNELAARYEAFSRRERALLAAAAIGGTLLVGFTVFVDPNLARARAAERLAVQQAADAQSIEAQLGAVKAQLQIDPDAGRKAEIARLKSELAKVEGALRNLESGLVAPDRMTGVLERLLAGSSGLRLVSLKSLPPVNLADAGNGNGRDKESSLGSPELGLYKHGVEMQIEGGYGDLYAWLSKLETSGEKILWGDVRMHVVEHPRSLMRVTIYTLSTDKAWLAI